MLNAPIYAAYKKRGNALWVTPCEIDSMLRRMRYAESVCIELRDWIARRMSMIFVAGQRGTKPPVTTADDLLRMLSKMGYCQQHAAEITDKMMQVVPGLYAKGQYLKNMH